MKQSWNLTLSILSEYVLFPLFCKLMVAHRRMNHSMWLKIDLVFLPATDDPEMCAVDVGPLMVSTVVVFASPPLELTPADRADTPADTWGPADPNTADWPTVIIGVNKLWQTSSWCGCCYPLVWAANQSKIVWSLSNAQKQSYVFHGPHTPIFNYLWWIPNSASFFAIQITEQAHQNGLSRALTLTKKIVTPR